MEHFFEADGLRAELDFVDGLGLGTAALVFDGERLPRAVGLTVKFDDIGDAVEAESNGLQRKRASDAQIAPRLGRTIVGAFVEHATLSGEVIFLPGALDVDERALARAEGEMLERRNRKRIEFGAHGAGVTSALPVNRRQRRRSGRLRAAEFLVGHFPVRFDGDGSLAGETTELTWATRKWWCENRDRAFVSAVGDDDGFVFLHEGERLGEAGPEFADGEGGGYEGLGRPRGETFRGRPEGNVPPSELESVDDFGFQSGQLGDTDWIFRIVLHCNRAVDSSRRVLPTGATVFPPNNLKNSHAAVRTSG